jgi:voltage-gated potassium channel
VSRFRSEQTYRRIERVTELPLLALAITLIPVLIVPAMFKLSPALQQTVTVIDWAIWGAFALDFSAKFVVVPNRLAYVRTHPLEAAMVVIPMLRPLRVLRVLKLVRVAVVLGVNLNLLQDIFDHKGTRALAGTVALTVLIGATIVFFVERQTSSSNLTEYGDALWWAIATVTTVGYGDHYPVSGTGRAIATVLMLVGIAGVSGLTATIAAYLVRDKKEEVSTADLLRKIETLERKIDALGEGRETAGPP